MGSNPTSGIIVRSIYEGGYRMKERIERLERMYQKYLDAGNKVAALRTRAQIDELKKRL